MRVNSSVSVRYCAYSFNNIYALLTKREVEMAGYWPSSFFLRFYGPRLRRGP